jgi:hypothetical protein
MHFKTFYGHKDRVFERHDTHPIDIQQNDTKHYGTQHNDIQHNNK